jgi:iron complex outermembrane receptor protein
LSRPAEAASPRIAFHVDAKRYSEALLDLAQQANVTLIGAAACEGFSRNGVAGAFTLEQALDQLLDGAPCTWRMVAPGAVEIARSAPEAARPPPRVQVSEVLVTATKRVANARQLAVSVTAVPGPDLQATGATDVGAAAGQLAGVLATNLGPGRNKLLLRGLSDGAYTGRARSTVVTYLDDIPINYNAPDPDLRLVDVDRVEVARGPQGALYGSGSLSGIYRIVSRKPEFDRFTGEVRLTGALTAHGKPSEATEGYVNVPLLGQAAALRLSAYQEIQGGYLDDVSLKRNDVDRTTREGGRLTLLLQPSDDWSVSLTGAGQHLNSEDTHYTRPGMGLTRANRIPEPHVNDIALASATLKRSWGWGEVTSSTGFIRHSYGSFYDATATEDLYTQFALQAAYSDRARTNLLVQDLFITSRGAGPVQWLIGAYGSNTREHTPTQVIAQKANTPELVVYGDDRHDRIREIAAYGEASYEFAPGWVLAAGGRVFDIRTHTTSAVTSELNPPRSLDRKTDFSGFSPKLSLQRQFRSGDLAYLVISEGHRSGGVNSGGAQPLSQPRESYAPDRLLSYEGGAKTALLDNRVAINASVFYDVWTDIQTDQFRPTGIPYTTNAGDAHILGAETEISYQVTDNLLVQLNGRVNRTRTSNPNIDFVPLLVNGLPGAPAVSGGVLVTYQRPVFGDWTLKLVGETTYVGRSRITWDFSGVPPTAGYLRAKVLAEVSRRNLGMQFFLTNPQNDYSDTFAFGNPFNPGRTRQITPQRPRTVGLTIFASY